MAKPTTIVQVVNAMVRSNKAQFDRNADIAAETDKKMYHHVYEWGEIARPEGRLWDFVVTGLGSNRELYYVFTESRKPVPISDAPGDTRSEVHIFKWKAPVMEAGEPLEVKPINENGLLVFPRGQHGNFASLNEDMDFSKQPVFVRHPGGEESVGSFGRLWESYWESWGERILVEDVIDPTNVIIREQFPELVATISKSRVSHTAGIHINTLPHQDMSPRGRQLVTNLTNSWKKAAEQREAVAGVADNSNL